MPRRKRSAVSLAGGAASGRPGRAGEGAADRAGARRTADAFDALRDRNLLDRLDIAANETLWHAGDRLRRHRHGAELDGPSSLDLARPNVDGGGAAESPGDAAWRHRDALRRAAAAVGPRLMPYVEAVVLAGRPVSSLRPLVGDTGHARTADALALERLREGLHRLCELWRMRPDARPLPIAGWRAAADGAPASRAEPT